MSEDHTETIEWECENHLYYISYPKNVGAGIWKDGEGKLHSMSTMGLDHLRACIRLVEKGLKYLRESNRHEDVLEELEPRVEQKLAELKKEFKKKTAI